MSVCKARLMVVDRQVRKLLHGEKFKVGSFPE